MTEYEWLTSTNPQAMLKAFEVPLRGPDYQNPTTASDRKLRLFACASIKLWGKPHPLLLDQLEDENQPLPKCYRTVHEAVAAWNNRKYFQPERADLLRDIFGNPFRPITLPLNPCEDCQGTGNCPDCDGAGELAGDYFADDGVSPCERCRGRGTCNYCRGKRGWPDRTWLEWNDGTIPKMAQAIYDERDFDMTPILADALEEAGCSDEICQWCKGIGVVERREYGWNGSEWHEVPCPNCNRTGRIINPILAHCRGSGTHARGCWVIDLLLGRQ